MTWKGVDIQYGRRVVWTRGFYHDECGFLWPFGADARPPSDRHDCVIAKCVAAPITKTESKLNHNTYNLDKTG